MACKWQGDDKGALQERLARGKGGAMASQWKKSLGDDCGQPEMNFIEAMG